MKKNDNDNLESIDFDFVSKSFKKERLMAEHHDAVFENIDYQTTVVYSIWFSKRTELRKIRCL